jgi:two-component system, chemotaxis family, sensor kinase CheA
MLEDFSPEEVEELLQIFLVTSDDILVQTEEALVSLETSPDDENTLKTIFRHAHSLKGSAGSLGFSEIATFSHGVEDVLREIQARTLAVTHTLITLLLQSVDALKQMVKASVAGSEVMIPSHERLLKQLADVVPQIDSETQSVAAELLDTENSVNTAQRLSPIDKQEEGQPANERAKSLRVDLSKLDRMLNLTGEISIERGRLTEMLINGVGLTREEIFEAHRESDRLYMELQELVMKVRMVTVGPTFRQHIRTVRDTATALGKQARLLFEGEDVEIDMTVIEYLRDPLTHMIRNALDHGIETPEIRKANGKKPDGQIILRAYHDAGSIVIQLADDGAGLNRERIASRARSRGIITEPEKMSDQEIYQLVFEPGFSTAETVTSISGRGVGMDVVRQNIESIRGVVNIDSREGQGATVTIRLPLTLAIIESLYVGSGGETYVIPMDAVLECVELSEEGRQGNNAGGFINLRGEVLPYLRLRDIFSLGGEVPLRENIVVVQYEGGRVGLAVDSLFGESQTVIKPLGKLFQDLPGISGSTIMGNGHVALILDVPGLVRQGIRRQTEMAVSV